MRLLLVDGARGFSELFAETPPPLEQLIEWAGPNLAVLPGGPRVPDPAQLLRKVQEADVDMLGLVLNQRVDLRSAYAYRSSYAPSTTKQQNHRLAGW